MKNYFLILCITILTIPTLLAQWSNNPDENLILKSGDIKIVKSVKTSNNRMYVSWFNKSGDNYNLCAQLLDADGNNLWDEEGLVVSSHPQSPINIENSVMLCDIENNLIIVFSDIRQNNNQGLVCYKLSQEGEFLWGNDGVNIIDNNNNDWITNITACVDSENELIVATAKYSENSNDIFLQRMTSDQTLPWGIQGKVIFGIESPAVFPIVNPMGKSIALIFKETTGIYPNTMTKLLYQYFDKDGIPFFSENRIVTDAGGIAMWAQYDALLTENNKIAITWHDDRDMDSFAVPYAQLIDEMGNTLWESNGIALSTEVLRNHFYPSVVGKVSDKIIFIWQNTDPQQTNKALYAQKVHENGNLEWGTNGKELFPEISHFNSTKSSVLDDNNFYIAYGLNPIEGNYDIVHYYINSYTIENADANWTEAVCFASYQAPKNLSDLCLTPIQIVATWQEGGFMDQVKEVRAQNINLNGSLGMITSVNEAYLKDLKIYPNPASNYLQVILENDNYIHSHYEILDTYGHLLSKGRLQNNTNSIDLTKFSNGLYFLRMNIDNTHFTKKIRILK